MSKTQNLEIVHGDTVTFDGFVTQDGVALDITGAKFWMTAKAAYSSSDVVVVFQLSSPSSGITITDAANGTIRITIPASATSTVPYASTAYVYDVQMKTSGGAIVTITRGTLVVVPDVTVTTT